jgi:DnaJ-class molecular chaperone
MECRRCSECEGSTHHWLDNDDFGNAEDDAEGPTGNSHVCKHCDVVGDECEECGGSGEQIDEGGGFNFACPTCVGEGVVPAKRETFAEFQAQREEHE